MLIISFPPTMLGGEAVRGRTGPYSSTSSDASSVTTAGPRRSSPCSAPDRYTSPLGIRTREEGVNQRFARIAVLGNYSTLPDWESQSARRYEALRSLNATVEALLQAPFFLCVEETQKDTTAVRNGLRSTARPCATPPPSPQAGCVPPAPR